MSKAVIYENTDKLVISTPFNAEFVDFLKQNVSKKDKEWNSRMKTWTIRNSAKEVVLAKVTEMFEIEEFYFDFDANVATDKLTAKITDEMAATFTNRILQVVKVGLCENTEGTVRDCYVSYDLSFNRIMNKKNGKFVVVYQTYNKEANEFMNYVRFYQITSNQVIEISYEQFKDVNFTAVIEVVFTKDVSPAPAPKNEEPKKVEKIETVKEENQVIRIEQIELSELIKIENGIIVAKEEMIDEEIEEIELKIEIDLINCETIEDVASAFKLATGNSFDMDYDDDLNNCENLSNAVVFYSKNYISIDDKSGNECYYNEICDTVKDSIDLYYYNAIKKEIEENKKTIKTRYWGEQYEYPIINETVDYKIMDGFENSRAYKCILQRAMNAADVETESWVMIDIEKFKDYTFDNETGLLYVETHTQGEFQHKGSSLSEETNMYQRISQIYYRNEFSQNFDVFKRDEDGEFTEERVEYDFLSFQITSFLKNKNYDADEAFFLFCDEDGDELNEERKNVFEDGKLNIPEDCKILQILGKTNPLIRD